MILMSYNIYEGAYSHGVDRTDALIGVIRSVGPSIIGLCECAGFWDDNAARLRRFENELGMRAVMNHACSGYHVALFSTPSVPILSADQSSTMMYHGYARIVVAHPKLGRVLVMMTHLHPYSALFRVGEAETIIASATMEPNAIVMGDFNCVAEGEAPSPATLSPNALARLCEIDGTPNSEPVKAFLARDFVDLGAHLRTPTYPTALFGKDKRYPGGLRLDYAFASKKLAPHIRCQPLATPSTEQASDHFPLICEMVDDLTTLCTPACLTV